MVKYPDALISLIEMLRRLPGVGTKSAERFAFHLLDWGETTILQFSALLKDLKKNILFCSSCGSMMIKKECILCNPELRDPRLLCVVPHARDVFAIEDTGKFAGMYHVIGGLLSPINNYDESHLNLTNLLKKLDEFPIQEVVLAFDSTLEGDATAFFLKEKLEEKQVTISRLAFGLPMGSSLEYIDGGTLSRAFTGRHLF